MLTTSLNHCGRILVAGCLCWAIGSSLYYYPHSLSYFNEIAGGPENGAEHLVDSNLDWGQDLFFLKKWYDAHPEARPFYLIYFGKFDPTAVGLQYGIPEPSSQELGQGYYAVSQTLLKGYRYPVPDGRGGKRVIDSDHLRLLQENDRLQNERTRIGFSTSIIQIRQNRS
ncbi:MAG: hypothetical protein L0Y72_09525 [Gemmataceae bacterium]|nr:hypothetical protein [Gemmataceae bacterium]